MDEGNLGTIQRTLLGLGLKDIAVIRPAADVFEPHVVRAAMGAVFSLRVKQYDSFEEYRREYPDHALYPFMLDGSMLLEDAVRQRKALYALVFGNEGSGLPPEFSKHSSQRGDRLAESVHRRGHWRVCLCACAGKRRVKPCTKPFRNS